MNANATYYYKQEVAESNLETKASLIILLVLILSAAWPLKQKKRDWRTQRLWVQSLYSAPYKTVSKTVRKDVPSWKRTEMPEEPVLDYSVLMEVSWGHTWDKKEKNSLNKVDKMICLANTHTYTCTRTHFI